jgi:predicted protein tyrosine phosphatase
MNWLFICSKNRIRSLTAEHIFQNKPGLQVRSAGTAIDARRRVNSSDIEWADHIFVMEEKHRQILEQKYPTQIHMTQVTCLDVGNEYQYMEEELVTVLEELLQEFLIKVGT